jgi:hypothetical protein
MQDMVYVIILAVGIAAAFITAVAFTAYKIGYHSGRIDTILMRQYDEGVSASASPSCSADPSRSASPSPAPEETETKSEA